MSFTESKFSFIVCVLYWLLLSQAEVGAVTPTPSPPMASLNITPSDTVTVVGRDTQLNCSFHHVGSNVPAWKFYDGVRYVEVTSGSTLHREGYNATLEASSGEYHLIMRNATLALAGIYECTLLGSSSFARAELVVLEYGPVCGVSPGHTVVSNQSESTFTCHVNGGTWGDLVWLKNGEEISRANDSTNEYSTRLQKTDNGAVYNCRYESHNISSKLWPQLTCIDDISVDVQYPATVAVTNYTIGPFLEGDEVFAVCEITEDGNPKKLNAWYWLEPDGRNNSDGGVLNLGSVSRRDTGTYTCVAENMYYDNSIGRGIALYDVHVHYSPSVQIEDLSDGKVIEGDVYLARCLVDAYPEGDMAWTDVNDDVISHDQELVIANSHRTNAGTYTCHANNTFFNGQMGYGNSSIFMDVQYFSGVNIEENSNGRVIQGNTFTADCVADSNPEADYKWTRPDRKVSTSSQLEIPSALKNDNGNYTCEANTTFWNGSLEIASAHLYLDVQYEPIITLITYGPINETGQVIVNSSIGVLCDVVESNPGVDVVSWGVRGGGDWLNFTSVTRGDHGNYSCTANNTFWDNTTGSTTLQIFLDVQYGPELTLSDVDNTGLEGRPFTKYCEVSGNPAANSVQWKYGDVVVSENQTLAFTPQRNQEGAYTCVATVVFWDGTQQVTAASFDLAVQYLPDVMVEEKILTVKEGENVTLNCEIDSKPPAVYHNWTKDDDVVSTDLKHVLGNVQRHDAGIYTCIAVNELYDGTLGTGYNETKVIVEYIPDVKIDIEAPIIKEGETAMFTCKIDSNPDVTYHNWTNDGVVVSTDLNLAIANAQRQHTGTYQCIAGNVFYDGTTGVGSNATELTVQYTPSVSVDKRRVSVREGENVTFSCEIDSNTDVTYHNWTKDGAVVSTNLSFTISGVDRLNFGFYECIAVTEFYDGTTGTARNQTELDVQYIPEVGILTEASIVREGEIAILSCKIDSNPDVTYHNWTKDGVVLSTDLNLTIANAQRQDTGTYQCIAGNVFYDGTTGMGSNATELTVQYVPGVTVEKASLTIKEGENVTLTCEIDSNLEITYHNWTKDGVVVSDNLRHVIDSSRPIDSGLFECTVVYKFYDGSTGTVSNRTELDVQYPPRVHIDDKVSKINEGETATLVCKVEAKPAATYHNWTKEGVVVSTELNYTIENATWLDSGHYECIAVNTFYDGTTGIGNDVTELSVEYFPNVAVVHEKVTVKEGENATLKCEVNSNPEVNYHNWTKEGMVLSTELNYTILDANRVHSGFYQCIAGNTLSDGRTGMSSSMVELDVQYPPEVSIDNEEFSIKKGERVSLICKVEANPAATYHNWTKNGVVVSTELNYTIENATWVDSGHYECIAVNTFYDGTTGMGNNVTELSVEDFPNVAVVDEKVRVKEGENATLKCEINSNPEVNYHNWTKEGVVLSSELNYTIFDANRPDSGFYQCIAGNTLSDGRTGTSYSMVELDVQYTPVVYIDNEEFSIKEGETATLFCRIEANPAATYHNWTKDGVVVSTELNYTIENATWLDSGHYECIAVNTFYDGTTGIGNNVTELNVEYFPNVAVANKIVTVKEGENATLKCEINSNPEVTYHNWTKEGLVLSTELNYTIFDANRLDSGSYQCIAGNTLSDGMTGTSYSMAELVVQYTPVVNIDNEEFSIKKGETATLICRVEANPPATYHNWTKDGVVVSTQLNYTIENATWLDSGHYECIAVNTFYDGTTGIGINVTELNVEYFPNVAVANKIVTVKEGENATLYCEINSNPEVTYHNWTKDGVVLSTELNFTIFDANRVDSGFYQCVAGNTLSDGTTGMSSSMAELDVQYTPDVNIESEASKIKEGETAKLTCRIESNPEATVHNWTKDGVIVSTGLNLTIGNARRLDSGLYECIAVNTLYDGTTGVAYYRTELSVQYFPNVTVDEKLVKIKEGGNATLKCEIDSNPEVTFHNWTKDGAVLSTCLTHTIGNVNRLDSGLYTCIAGNTLYDGTTGISNSTAELSVEYLAVTESHGPSGAVVEGVNKTMIGCTVTDGVPDPHTITLFHVNETVNRVDSTESPNGVTSHTFDLGVTQRWHNGSYYCETQTRFEDNSEESEISDEISVIVHYKPTITTTDETIFVREGSRATLTCTAEAYPGADITWMKAGKTLDVGTDSSTYVIQAVTEDNAGEYICKAENDIGIDQVIIRVSITTLVEKDALKEPLNYTLVILAAVPIIILSILIITFVVVKALRSGKLQIQQVPYENHFYIHPDAGNKHFVGTVEMRY